MSGFRKLNFVNSTISAHFFTWRENSSLPLALSRSRGAAVGRYTQIYMNVEFLVEGLKSGFYRCLLQNFSGGACPHTPLESSVIFDTPLLPNYRGSKITTNDLFLQIYPFFVIFRTVVNTCSLQKLTSEFAILELIASTMLQIETTPDMYATNSYRSNLVWIKSCVARVPCDIWQRGPR